MSFLSPTQPLPIQYTASPSRGVVIKFVNSSLLSPEFNQFPIFDPNIPKIDLSTRNESWSQLNAVFSDLDRQISSGSSPTDDWMFLVQSLYYFEEEKLLLNATDSDLAQHKTWLESLQRQGMRMFTLPSCGDKSGVQAQLEVLRIKELGWHGKMNAADASHLLGEVFGGKP